METENRRQSEGQNVTTCFGLSENTAHLSTVCEERTVERTVDNESTDLSCSNSLLHLSACRDTVSYTSTEHIISF